MTTALMNYLTEIHFGAKSVQIIPSLLSQKNVQRPLIVTDNGLVDLGILDRLPFQAAGVFSEIPTNPTEHAVKSGVIAFKAADCDGIVAVGGGSPIDCAKAIGLSVTHQGGLGEYAVIRGGLAKITSKKPPLIAVPTTSGTGSEVGRAALITLDDGEKLGLISPHLIPDVAVCDPELTLGLPPTLTAATGMDAISHCIETYCSPKVNPVAESIALDGLARAFKAIRGAVADGSDIELRSEMMMAALQGGLTFQKGLGMIHSLSHPMGAIPGRRLHHGTLNAIFLPHVLRFNASACPEKMQRMAEVLNVSSTHLPEVFERLNSDTSLPSKLSEIGVTTDDLTEIPQLAMQDHSTPTNPRAMTIEDCEQLLRESL
jgi:4-hydroxybutyrate dehydrogenase